MDISLVLQLVIYSPLARYVVQNITEELELLQNYTFAASLIWWEEIIKVAEELRNCALEFLQCRKDSK
jgi:hypothetical protein